MAITTNLNANTNANSNQREAAVMYYNPSIFGWEPRFGQAITQSDINKSEVLQAIVAAIVELDGEMLPGKPYTFDGVNGHFKSATPKVKPAEQGITITLTSTQG